MKMFKEENIPRLLGVILLAIAIAAYFTGRGGFFVIALSAVAGLTLLLTNKKKAAKQFKLFKQSFKQAKTISFTTLYDLLFLLFFLAAVFVNIKLITDKTEQIMQNSDLTTEAFMDPATAAANTAAVKGFLAYFLGGIAILFVIGLALYALSRMMMWSRISDKKPSYKLYKKYLGLHAIWWVIWSPLFLFLAFVAGKEPAARILMMIAMIFSMYFTLFVQSLFAEKQKIGYSIGHGIGFGISKIPKLLLPASYALLAYVVLYQLLNLMRYAPSSYWSAINILFVLIFLNWLRLYMYPTISSFKD